MKSNIIDIAAGLICNSDKHRHISFIIYKNRIVSIGYSQARKTDPMAKRYGHRFSSIHSELHSIKKFPFRPSKLAKCMMVNIRIMANGSIGISKPCENCQKLLIDFGLKAVYYTNRKGDLVRWQMHL